MEEAKKILDKYLKIYGWEKEITKESNIYNSVLTAVIEALHTNPTTPKD